MTLGTVVSIASAICSVGEGVHLAKHERRPLSLREPLDVVDEQSELLTLVDLVGGRRAVLGQVDVHRVDADGLNPAEVVEAAVAGAIRYSHGRTLIGRSS